MRFNKGLRPLSVSQMQRKNEWMISMTYAEVKWSGKEDSNLRPLPPEGGSPDGIARFSVLSGASNVLSDGTCSLAVHGARFTLNLNPCLSANRALALRAGEVG